MQMSEYLPEIRLLRYTLRIHAGVMETEMLSDIFLGAYFYIADSMICTIPLMKQLEKELLYGQMLTKDMMQILRQVLLTNRYLW